MQTGIIKIFKENRGFGFVTTKDESSEFFFRIRNINIDDECLRKGQLVWFDITLTENGLEAVNVQPYGKV